MGPQVTAVSCLCFYQMRQLCVRRVVQRSLTKNALRSLVQAFIHCWLDCCNALLAGITDTQIKRLQLVQNTAARLVSGARRWDHITPVLCSLHWLPVQRRIIFKTARASYGNVSMASHLHICKKSACRWRKFKDVLDCGRHRLDVSTCQEYRHR